MRHAEVLKALEGGTDADGNVQVGETSTAKKAPAPIKNDDKASYKEKKKSDNEK